MNPQGPAGRDPDAREAPPEDIDDIDLDRAIWDAAYRRSVLRRMARGSSAGVNRQKNDDTQS